MQVDTYYLSPRDWVPNHARLPVILYRQAIDPAPDQDMARAFEEAFARHGWPAQWRDGIYDYHHYHSTAHEVLGVAAGTAQVTIGGPGGLRIAVRAGDALLLPAGTGHRARDASGDFLVVGAYPRGQAWDVCRQAPDEAMRQRIDALPFPASDPVVGSGGPLLACWS